MKWTTSRITWPILGCFTALWLRNQESFLEKGKQERVLVSKLWWLTGMCEGRCSRSSLELKGCKAICFTVVDLWRMLMWGETMSVSTISSVCLLRFLILEQIQNSFSLVVSFHFYLLISSFRLSTSSESALSVKISIQLVKGQSTCCREQERLKKNSLHNQE